MTFVFGARSLAKLKGIHPDLRKVMDRAIELTPIDFAVTEGLRTEARQKELVAIGASKTLRSRHLTGHAVDIAPFAAGKLRWDWPLFH
ncbi:MAG: M15 family metallopeptidase, partial [Betaproteobacteria bacterium]